MIANIIGASGSGKTSLVRFLLYKYPTIYRKLTPYTTRIRRTSEKQGIDYHFVNEEFFSKNDDLILKRVRADGLYATHKSDLDVDDGRITLTTFPPKGVVILEKLGFKVRCFNLHVTAEQRKIRMLGRGDLILEIENRLVSDEEEYSKKAIEDILPYHFLYLLDGSKPIEEVALLFHSLMI